MIPLRSKIPLPSLPPIEISGCNDKGHFYLGSPLIAEFSIPSTVFYSWHLLNKNKKKQVVFLLTILKNYYVNLFLKSIVALDKFKHSFLLVLAVNKIHGDNIVAFHC